MNDEAAAGKRAGIGLALLVGVATVAVVSLAPGDDTLPDSSGASMVAATASPLPATSAGALPSPPGAPPLAAPDGTAAGAPPSAPPGMTEVCGVGWVRSESTAAADATATATATARTEAAMQRLASRMQAAPGERARAVGWFLQRGLDGAAASADQAATVGQRCGDDRGCRDASEAENAMAYGRASLASTNEIARLAAASRDPFVYAVAAQACLNAGTSPTAPACQLISDAQWARLDPGNGVPWVHLAAAAAARDDASGLDEAMHRVARAHVGRVYGDEVAALATEYLPDAANDVEKLETFVWLVGVSAAWALPAYRTVTKYCGASEVTDSNRLQVCDAVAHRWVADPSSLLERGLGVRIAERVKWPAEQVAALREENEVLVHVYAEALYDPQPSSCRALARARGLWLKAARVGEYKASRQLVEASGKSMAVLVGEARARRQAGRAAQAEAERNAASSPGADNASPSNKKSS